MSMNYLSQKQDEVSYHEKSIELAHEKNDKIQFFSLSSSF